MHNSFFLGSTNIISSFEIYRVVMIEIFNIQIYVVMTIKLNIFSLDYDLIHQYLGLFQKPWNSLFYGNPEIPQLVEILRPFLVVSASQSDDQFSPAVNTSGLTTEHFGIIVLDHQISLKNHNIHNFCYHCVGIQSKLKILFSANL